jgi:hypothetical protein
MYSCITSICRLLGALLVILTAYAAPAGAQLTTSGFPLTTLTGNEIIDCQPPATNPPTSPWITTCTVKQIAQVGLPIAINITPDCANTPGVRAPIYVCNDLPGNNNAGQNAGLQVWIGSGPTATPAANSPAAATFYIDNLNSRGGIWTINTIATQQPISAGGAVGPVHGNEANVVASIPVATPTSAFTTGSWTHGWEAVCNQNTGANPVPCQTAFWVWAAGDYENGSNPQYQPWNIAYGASRTQYAGFDCEINPGGASDTGAYFKQGCFWDQSNSAVSLLVSGAHTSIIDVSGATSYTQFVNCGLNICSFAGGGGVSFASKVALQGDETHPLTWQIGGSGQAWQMRENAGGTLYVYDSTNNKIQLIFAENNGGVTLGATGESVSIAGILGIPQSTWTDTQACNAGQISVDFSFVYVCTATNTVKRAALSTF